MDFFDFFTKEDGKTATKTKTKPKASTYSAVSKPVKDSFDTFKPGSFKDLYTLIDLLKSGKSIIVDCSELKEATAIRVLDILSGATYALDGDWKSIASEIFMFVPHGSPENGKF